jgi:hypothetical protein
MLSGLKWPLPSLAAGELGFFEGQTTMRPMSGNCNPRWAGDCCEMQLPSGRRAQVAENIGLFHWTA